MTKTLSYYTQNPAAGGNPKKLIVLLHGYGSNGQDLISLAPYWQPSVPNALFVSPDAPFPCELGIGFQWFSLGRSLDDVGSAVTGYDDFINGAEKAHKILDAFLDTLLDEHRLEDKDLALVGFSQGTMMALYTGLRRKDTIAGVLGYSGALLGGAEGLDNPNKPPIRLIHGQNDSVVPVEKYHHAVKILSESGYTISGHTTPMLEHSIDGEGIESGAGFLKQALR